MTVDMGRGFFVAFNSKYVESRLIHAPSENRWDHRDDSATAWSCLRCGAKRGKDEVLGVALRGIPSSYDFNSLGLSVCIWPLDRSEEHTSELQSLMRISYAVFCLKKKKETITIYNVKT